MKRLIYTSKAVRRMSENDITKILSVSRLNNQLYNITGLLLHHEDRFLQVLEGAANDLTLTYDRIRKDWRHSECRLLLEETVVQRAFNGWDMAYRDHGDLLSRQRLQLLDIGQIVERATQDDLTNNAALYVFLKAFVSSFETRDAA